MSKLGTDIVVPEIAKASATKSNVNGFKANNTSAIANTPPGKTWALVPFEAWFPCPKTFADNFPYSYIYSAIESTG